MYISELDQLNLLFHVQKYFQVEIQLPLNRLGIVCTESVWSWGIVLLELIFGCGDTPMISVISQSTPTTFYEEDDFSTILLKD